MASVGSISIELELRDGDFVARSRRAGQVVRELNGHFGALHSGIGNVESAIFGTLGKLRDLAIVGHAFGDVVYGLKTIFGSWSSEIIDANAQLEKMQVLLQGLSKQGTEGGRIREAADDMQYLIDKSQQAPFSVKELSNAFVKLKTTGLSDVRNDLNSLADSVARFGGGEQELHRATVALMQMSSKGVVSMEELRQQLGEAVPSAMQSMADGMGVTMSKLVAEVSKGKVSATPAIQAMMDEMDRTMRGSSARMMETWTGMVSQFSTQWTLLKANIADAGMFDAAKEGLREIMTAMNSGHMLEIANSFGSSIGEAIQWTIKATKTMIEYSDAIGKATQAMLAWIVAVRGVSILATLAGVIGSAATSIRTLSTAIEAAAKVTTVGTAAIAMGAGTTANIVNGAFMNMSNAQTIAAATVTRTATLYERALAILRAGVMAIGGPLSALTIAIGGAAVAWTLFGDKLDTVADKAKKAKDEIEDLKYGSGELNIFTEKSYQEQMDRISNIANHVIELRKAVLNGSAAESQKNSDSMNSFAKGTKRDENTDYQKKAQEDLAWWEKFYLDVTAKTYAARNEMIERYEKENLKNTEKNFEAEIVSFTKRYESEKALAEDAKKKAIDSGQSEVEAQKAFNSQIKALGIDLYNARIAAATKLIEENQAVSDSLSKTTNIQVLQFDQNEIKKFEGQKYQLLSDIGAIDAKIAQTNKNSEVFKELTANRDNKVQELKKIETAIGEVTERINALKSKGAIEDSDIVRFEVVNQALDNLKGKLKDFQDARARLLQQNGKITLVQDTEKDMKKFITSSITDFENLAFKIKEAEATLKGLGKEAERTKLENAYNLNSPELEKESDIIKELLDRAKFLKEGADTMDKGALDNFLQYKATGESILNNLEMQVKTKERLEAIGQKIADNEKRIATQENNGIGVKKDYTQMFSHDEQKYLSTITDEKLRIQLTNQLADSYKKLEQSELNVSLATKSRQDNEKAWNEQRRLAEQDEKYSNDRKKWFADQVIALEKEIDKEKLKTATDGIVASKVETNERLADIKRLAEAQAESNGLKKAWNPEGHKKYVDDVVNEMKKKLGEISDAKDNSSMVSRELASTRELKQLKIGLIRDSIEKEREMIMENTRIQLEENDKISRSEKEKAEMRDQIYQKQALQIQQMQQNHETAFQKMLRDPQRLDTLLSDIGVSAVDGLSQSFVELGTNGAASFRQMTASILKDIAAMIIKFSILAVVKQVAGALTSSYSSSFTSSLNSINADAASGISSSLSSGSSYSSSITPSFSSGTYALGGVAKFAKGGKLDNQTMSQLANSQFASKSDMLKGGIAQKSKVAIFGEGDNAEAFLPLKNDKFVPLEVFQDKNGKMTANVLMPNGQKIPTLISGTLTSSVNKYANGGMINNTAATGRTTTDEALVAPKYLTVFESINETLKGIHASIEQGALKNASKAAWDTLGTSSLQPQFGTVDPSGKSASQLAPSAKSSGNIAVNINVTNNGQGNQQQTKSQNGQDDSPDSKKMWDKFAERMKTIVLNEIAVQKRPGGLLYE